MLVTRRGLILSALAAPLVVRTPGLLMPVSNKHLVAPRTLMHYNIQRNVWVEWECDIAGRAVRPIRVVTYQQAVEHRMTFLKALKAGNSPFEVKGLDGKWIL